MTFPSAPKWGPYTQCRVNTCPFPGFDLNKQQRNVQFSPSFPAWCLPGSSAQCYSAHPLEPFCLRPKIPQSGEPTSEACLLALYSLRSSIPDILFLVGVSRQAGFSLCSGQAINPFLPGSRVGFVHPITLPFCVKLVDYMETLLSLQMVSGEIADVEDSL